MNSEIVDTSELDKMILSSLIKTDILENVDFYAHIKNNFRLMIQALTLKRPLQ